MRIKSMLMIVLAVAGLAACGGKKSGGDTTTTPKTDTLYARLGGEAGVKGVVHAMVGNIAADARINKFFANADIPGLEKKLYEKECMPSVWLPAAQGGQLEIARALVADRLTRAVASGDPNVNAHVAAARLAAADAAAAAGQYQHACRDLCDGLHALTTP